MIEGEVETTVLEQIKKSGTKGLGFTVQMLGGHRSLSHA